MSQEDEKKFDVVFFGILQPGKDKETALSNLAKLFKTQPEKLAPLFAGGRKVIKGNISEEVANKYLTALENVGLVVKTEECEIIASEPAKATSPEPESKVDTGTLTVAEVGADVLKNPPEKEVQKIDDFSFLSMAEVGADVLENPVEVEPQVIADFSDIKLEK